MIKKIFFIGLLIALFLLLGCAAQNVQPTAPVYNITITQTDNSQVVVGDNNKAKATPKTEAKATADIKPEVKANAELTTKNGMWIYWLIITLTLMIAGWLCWKKWGGMLYR